MSEQTKSAGEDKAPAHTPGPWKLEKTFSVVSIHTPGKIIATVNINSPYERYQTAEELANAELIASSPGLAQQLAEANQRIEKLRADLFAVDKDRVKFIDEIAERDEQLAQANRDKQELAAMLRSVTTNRLFDQKAVDALLTKYPI